MPPELNNISARDAVIADSTARQEVDDYAARKNREHRHIHRLFLTILWTAAVIGTLCLLVLLWHFTAPACWRWLGDGDLDKLKTVLGGALFGGSLDRLAQHKLRESKAKGNDNEA